MERKRERARQTDRDGDRQTGTERQRQRDRDRGNSNSKTLFYKDYSLGSVKTCFATSKKTRFHAFLRFSFLKCMLMWFL